MTTKTKAKKHTADNSPGDVGKKPGPGDTAMVERLTHNPRENDHRQATNPAHSPAKKPAHKSKAQA